MRTREERLAANEALFREVNERIAEVSERFALEEVSAICECATADCTQRFELSRRDYEEVRSASIQFVVVPGHEKPDIERVVDRRGRYLIVEKIGEGAEVAEEQDRREHSAARED
jgi:hypothetical protein